VHTASVKSTFLFGIEENAIGGFIQAYQEISGNSHQGHIKLSDSEKCVIGNGNICT
jgi:hypothetical protein